ncbi:hypothetical protein [Enterococcus columbae]|uniref:Uncharacterized protein n=1 Tax=Enterococcus columbae DSM 7374 = ATCC 51263 TaxID=1121865 RepID=S0KPL1_9ENTE|nr:hypothetical protein [Enterococcus columbae]EOT42865.1 hypothetical protein OMW_00843 [Enterococcus columbae DSM 7374 = ATCC 51263]EOW87698.1 hypothetical protein I568_00363 [Enterococcus columbae DSM 7374 = ATCC 51263]
MLTIQNIFIIIIMLSIIGTCCSYFFLKDFSLQILFSILFLLLNILCAVLAGNLADENILNDFQLSFYLSIVHLVIFVSCFFIQIFYKKD